MSKHLPECPKSGCPACYTAGLDAAREAVAAAYEGHFTENGVLYRDADPATGLRALDAIIDGSRNTG